MHGRIRGACRTRLPLAWVKCLLAALLLLLGLISAIIQAWGYLDEVTALEKKLKELEDCKAALEGAAGQNG